MTDLTIEINAQDFRDKLALKDGKDGEKGPKGDRGDPGESILGPRGPVGSPGIPGNVITPLEVRDKLRELKSPERLNLSDLDGLEKIDETFQNMAKGFAPKAISSLYDVQIQGISDGQALLWNANKQKFINGTVSSGGGSGDVVGPASSTDEAIVRFNGTTGKLIQDYTSGAPTISDIGDITMASGTILKIATVNFLYSVGTSSGYLAGAGNTSSTATSSLGIGFNALHAVETNGFNVAVGNQAMELTTSGGANVAVGYKALNANVIGTGNIALGANAGRYAISDNEFYVNGINRTSTALDKTASLLYGVMFPTGSVSSQTLVTNAAFTATYGFNTPTGQLYKINGSQHTHVMADITDLASLTRTITSISSPTTAGSTALTDYVYLVSGTTTVTLPTAVGNKNLYTIKNVSTGVVTVATTSGQTIDGGSTAPLPVRYTSIDLISDNSNWSVI